jgi:uncharacterized protein YggE
LAELSGQALGPAVSITETISSPPIQYPWDRGVAEDGAATPIEPGTSAVTVALQVQFSLEA